MLSPDLFNEFMLLAKDENPHLAHRSNQELLSLVGAERKGTPTLSGMLVLSDYPQQVYPNLCVTAVAVTGTS